MPQVEILSLHKLRDEFLAEKASQRQRHGHPNGRALRRSEANGQALVQKLDASEAEISRSKKDTRFNAASSRHATG